MNLWCRLQKEIGNTIKTQDNLTSTIEFDPALATPGPRRCAGLVRRKRAAEAVEPQMAPSYTTVLSVARLALAVVPVVRFFRTAGLAMLGTNN